jgi:hypothetical protein
MRIILAAVLFLSLVACASDDEPTPLDMPDAAPPDAGIDAKPESDNARALFTAECEMIATCALLYDTPQYRPHVDACVRGAMQAHCDYLGADACNEPINPTIAALAEECIAAFNTIATEVRVEHNRDKCEAMPYPAHCRTTLFPRR